MKIHLLMSSLMSGGAQFAIPDIVKTLQALGHDVSIIVCEPNDMGTAGRLSAAGLSWTLLTQRRRSKLRVLLAYFRKARADRPDVIWTSLRRGTWVGQWVGRVMKIPVVTFKHSATVRRYNQRMRRMSQLWVGDSPAVSDFLRETMGIPEERIMTWPFFKADPAVPQATPWDGESVLQLGSVGRLHSVKNYASLIEALGELVRQHPRFANRFHLTILGEGPERPALEALITRLGLSDMVSLPGFSADVGNFLAGLHVYLQPSDYEGMCLAVHEAMNAGLPIVATPVGEIPRAVQQGETGWLLHGELVPALCEVIRLILADPTALQRYGEQARRYVLQTYSRERYQQAAARIVNKLSTGCLTDERTHHQ